MRLELSRKAQADLDEIRDFSVQAFGVVRALAYLDQIEQAFRHLLNFPEIGSSHPGLRQSVRSLACEQHRIFYDINGDRIVVQRILHKAMDVDLHF
jgi:toxin ParE1/3/4